ncbi:MAG TPA: helix-turn-helix domain-containing protein [Chryseolinea sp.]|nr:helix-turn-helix domain-containing protein [Chryseolinea sp.]
MKHLTIVVPDGQNNLTSIVGSYKLLNRANEFCVQQGKEPVFNIHVAGLSKSVEFYDGLFVVRPREKVTDIRKSDLIIIPALKNYAQNVKRNAALANWIKQQYDRGAEVASICTGAFLLASTGLLDNETCSTHWVAANEFRTMFPKVNLVTEHLITDNKRIYTNGGAFSFLNLLLYLIEKYYDRQTAIFCSKIFQIDMDRHSQSPFTIFRGQKEHDDDVIKKTQEMLEKNVQKKMSFEKIAENFALSRRNFDRRFVKATGNTPAEYHQRVRIESAKKAFENTGKSISEVMYAVGYSDEKAFRDIFRRFTGMSPLEYRGRYNKECGFKPPRSLKQSK